MIFAINRARKRVVSGVLSYDFDMFRADDPHLASAYDATRTGPRLGEVRSNSVLALFRDQKTADAVTSSPPIIRLFLEEIGFGLSVAGGDLRRNATGVNAPDMRRTLKAQLQVALANRALKKALVKASRDSAFDVGAFISWVVSSDKAETAVPFEEATPRKPASPLRRPKATRPTHVGSSAAPTQTASQVNGLGDLSAGSSDEPERVVPRRPSDLRRNSLQGRAHQR